MSKEDDLRPHAIVLPSNSPVAICLSRGIAEAYAKAAYPHGGYKIRLARKDDIEYVTSFE